MAIYISGNIYSRISHTIFQTVEIPIYKRCVPHVKSDNRSYVLLRNDVRLHNVLRHFVSLSSASFRIYFNIQNVLTISIIITSYNISYIADCTSYTF